ncbi:MAG TPA: ROK family protein [Caulobacter sp.]|nr:ROK family protein [Caulobacter sp.]
MLRLGVDFGGTKIEAAALDEAGRFVSRVRLPNPGAYGPALEVVRQVIEAVEAEAGQRFDRVGMGIPGSISPASGLIRNANSHWLNDRPLPADLEAVLGRQVRLRNDADCMIISEAVDGAAAGVRCAFGVIIGTGCGGGLAVGGEPWSGANAIAGEWGHTPLPWLEEGEYRSRRCWCGRWDCIETFLSGPGLVEDYRRQTGRSLEAPAIVAASRAGEPEGVCVLEAYMNRLGRALAMVCDVLDPDVIVLAGGMSNLAELYDRLPGLVGAHVFSDTFRTPIRQAAHGDSSGVRGAAWLWPPA